MANCWWPFSNGHPSLNKKQDATSRVASSPVTAQRITKSTKETTKPTTPEPEPECQVPGWNTITVDGKSFEIYVSDRYGSEKTLSWFEADSMAKDVGGYLAEIKSAEETELIIGIKKCG